MNRLKSVLGRLSSALPGALPVPGVNRMARRVWVGNGRAHIEVRGIDCPGNEDAAKHLEERLRRIRGIHWAEVNAVMARVIVAFDASQVDVGDLVDVIEQVEEEHDLHTESFPKERPDHPADIEPVQRQLISITGDAVGITLAALRPQMGLRTRPSVPEDLATVLTLVDATPRLRHEIEARLGRAATDLTLSMANAAIQGLARRPIGLLVDAAQRALLLSEIAARRSAWLRREPELARDGHPETPVPATRRVVPLPPGPIERYADRVSFAALAVAGGVVATTRNHQRARTVLTISTPRAARLSRDAFAARLGRALADRGVIPFDPSALRRLDRIDTVVIDSQVLTTGRWAIEELRGVDQGLSPEAESRLRARAASLMEPANPERLRRRGGWTLGPLAKMAPDLPPPMRTTPALLRRPGGVGLGLLHREKLVAVLVAVPEPAPNAMDLVTAARSVGRFIIAGVGSGLGERFGADAIVARGSHLATEIRTMQEQGGVVALVADDNAAALRTSDCGIGVQSEGGPAPWGAHLMCGPGLAQARRILDAVVAARAVSRRGALISMYGSVAAALLALAGTGPGATGRALLAVNGAAVAGIMVGALSSRSLDRQPDPVPTDDTEWHAMEIETALSRLDSGPTGLTDEDASVRLAERPTPDGGDGDGFVDATLGELANPLTPMLATGAAVSAASGSVTDAVLIASVMGANALLGAGQRVSADRALRRLVRDTAVRARIRRDGAEVEINADEIVPGDVITLRSGDAVPADCRILEAVNLEVDESSLTGESQTVSKAATPTAAASVAERRSMLYDGTIVAAGEATGVVVATGPQSEAGRSAHAAEGGSPRRGVQERLLRMTGASVPIALGSGAALIIGGLLRGRPLGTTLGTAVSLAVAAVPEGLPLVATVGQIAAARRLSQRGALVRDQSTIEALGRVDVLCFDKTGTLTEGRVGLQRISDGIAEEPINGLSATARDILAAGLRASPVGQDEVPHPTDRAVIVAGTVTGVAPGDGVGGWRLVQDLPFEPARGYHAALGATANGQLLCLKGAPEIVLPACTRWRRADEMGPLDDESRGVLEKEVDRLARRGYRVLAVAQRAASARRQVDPERVRDLEFLGLLALADAARPAAREAVAKLRLAGVRVIMITGDHPSTAEAVAAELDILNGGEVLTGPALDALDDAQLAQVLPRVSVFARVTPSHKVRIVQALQRSGHTVAMTGDGANDAAAIRLADVGVALGQRGTDAARESADLIVMDDRIETIIDAVVEGRAMWASIRDAVSVLLGGNLGEIAFTLGTGLLAPAGSPLNARQLLLVNLLTDLLPSMALAVRPPATRNPERLLHEGPEASLGSSLTRDTLIRTGTTATSTAGAWLVARGTGTAARAGTVALVTLVGTQLGQTVAAGWRSPLVVGASAVSAAALGAIVQTPGVSHFFGCRPLGPIDWLTALTASGVGTATAIAANVVAQRVWPDAGGPHDGGSDVREQPVQEQPVQEQPVQEQPVQEQPVQEQPVRAQPQEPQASTLDKRPGSTRHGKGQK